VGSRGREDEKWEGKITWIQILDGKEGKMVDVKWKGKGCKAGMGMAVGKGRWEKKLT